MTNKPIQLKGLDFTVEEIKESRKRSGLLRIGIAIGEGGKNRQCNSKCPYCFEDQESDIKKFSLEEIASIVDRAKELGARTIAIIGYGEPLLPKRLEETYSVLEIISKKGLTPILFTNGISATEKVAKRLYELNATVVTKLNSFKPTRQDYLTGKRGSYERMRKGLENLMKAGFNKPFPTRLSLQTILFHDNLKELPELAKFCVENNIYPYFEALKFIGELRKNPQLYVDGGQIKKAFESVIEQYPNIFGTNGEIYIPQGKCCLQHYYGSLFVTPAGVFPCSGLNYNLGDVRKTTLKQILESEVIHQLRHLPDYVQGKCKTCPNIKDTETTLPKCYGGCRADTYANTGSIFEQDPLCWRWLK